MTEPAVATEGWAYPTLAARKAHYFRDRRSLCGKYGDFGLKLDTDTRTSPDDCAVCRRRLDNG